MRALLTVLCAVGVVAATTVTASAQEIRSRNSTQPDGGVTYDAGGAPYSRGQQNYDSSNDFQLQGDNLNDPANRREPAGAGNVNDKANKRDIK